MRFSWLASKHSTILTILLVVSSPGVTFADGGECSGLFQEVKPARRVIVEITDKKLLGFRDETSEELRIPIVNIRLGTKKIQLKNLEPLEIASDARVFIFATAADGKRRHVEIPDWIRGRLRDYLRMGGPPADKFDCICFAKWMNRMPFEFGRFDATKWTTETMFGEESVVPGDTILLGYSLEEVNHLAIYLGSGFYVSKLGIGGPVLITTFPTLQLIYGGFLFARATPKKEDANPTPVP